jgi:predicted DNA-binding transcriptional regulator AlpA
MKEYTMAGFLKRRALHDPPISSTPLNHIATSQFDYSAELPAELKTVIAIALARSDRVIHRAKPTAERAGLGLSTLWREVASGLFVPPISITETTCGWLEFEIDAVLEAKKVITRCDLKLDMRLFVHMLTRPCKSDINTIN